MLPNNIDLIDTLVFERQQAVQNALTRHTVNELGGGSFWTRMRRTVNQILGGPITVTAEAHRTEVIPVTTDRPVPLTIMHVPTTIEQEILDRAA